MSPCGDYFLILVNMINDYKLISKEKLTSVVRKLRRRAFFYMAGAAGVP